MRLLNFTIIKLTTCFITGILIGYHLKISLASILLITGLLLVALVISLLIAKTQFIKTIWFGVFTFTLMISVGVLTVNLHNQKNFSNHYSKHIQVLNDSTNTITFSIRDVLKPNAYYYKYIIDILVVNGIKTKGKSLLNIKKDSLQPPLKVDAIFTTIAEFKIFTEPLNPHQFNYKKYLDKKYIQHQLFIKNSAYLTISEDVRTLTGVASRVRDYINLKLKPYNFKPDELAIINALILGQRQDISEAIYSNYTQAGAIHILAVSGLHVGILLIILSYLVKPLEHFKRGKLLKTILLIFILWSFAFIAGLSASVTRAVTMFSIVTVALNLKRPTNIYNTLAISMFVILLVKPLFLFDVGFQLSYIAVVAIVAIDPHLYSLWRPKNRLLDVYWHTLTVTIAAQIGIIPLSLFYFHQFPGLFFISNLAIIPLLGGILGFGMLIIFLAVFNLLPQPIANIYGSIIGLMNDLVGWVSGQDTFIFKDISFNAVYLLGSYLLIFFGVFYLIKRKLNTLKLLFISIIIFQLALIYTKYKTSKNEFVIFHKNRFSVFGNTSENKMIYSDNFDSITALKNTIIRDYTVGNGINNLKKDTIKSVYILNKKTLLVVDRIGIYQVKSFTPDYVLLRQSPKINLNRLIDSISPKYIIADGSNYTSYIKQWEAVCLKRKLPFHQTSKKGAFIIAY